MAKCQRMVLIPGRKYSVGWSHKDLRLCTFKKVTDKGFAFIDKNNNRWPDTQLIYPPKDKKLVKRSIFFIWKPITVVWC